ncbi:MAG: transposase [Phycisphaerae bacterium]|nr:transposase [Phycisphaerae bacterium]NIS53855.1 transposase [Phycisphaerae bacterium]NIU12065.1 transposase [Phycisphaerae bacterium]NIU59244.1 transposase [Phycisphaerae bacterium]NIW95603.1 transposase [Phycisphaerae bacterium]
MPETLTIRILRFHTAVPGFRGETIIVATTLLDPKAYPFEEIAGLYRDRWIVELRLRDIKTTLGMDILRGKSADVVRKEIYMHLLVYNLIRVLMWQASESHDRPLHRLSFAGTLQRVNVVLPYLWLFSGTKKAVVLYQYLLSWIARDKLPFRPNRIEPRVVKRRPKEYALLNKPRSEMREDLLQ